MRILSVTPYGAGRGSTSFTSERGLKIEVFVAADSEYEASVRARRVLQPVGDGPSARHLWIASAEDTILAKLAWYRRGGEVSERQWSDVQGVIELRNRDLDIDYLRRWAPILGVADLLEQALTEAQTRNS